MKKVLIALQVLLVAGAVQAATYYVDPSAGAIGNDGSVGSPWNTLENVLSAKTLADGDTLLLQSGYHGTPSAGSAHDGYVTVMAADGQVPVIKSLAVSSPRWTFDGLTVTPSAAATLSRTTMISISSAATYVTVQNCSLYSVPDISAWSASDWTSKASTAINVQGAHTVIRNNHVTNFDHGIMINKSAPFCLVEYNFADNFAGDGMRGLADDCLFQYNTVRNPYKVDDNHDDMFQSYSTDANGNNPGTGTVYRVTLRGNSFIQTDDPGRDMLHGCQGIGCFDGGFEGWRIENNLIMIDHYHGITLYGAKNCTTVNNTVMTFPGSSTGSWITLTGTGGGNLVRNNIATALQDLNPTYTTIDHNIVGVFGKLNVVDYAGMDWSLKPGGPAYSGVTAIDGGSADGAPAVDILGTARPYGAGVDVGCYEYVPAGMGGHTFPQQLQDGSVAPVNPVTPGFMSSLKADIVIFDARGAVVRPAQVQAGVYYLQQAGQRGLEKVIVAD